MTDKCVENSNSLYLDPKTLCWVHGINRPHSNSLFLDPKPLLAEQEIKPLHSHFLLLDLKTSTLAESKWSNDYKRSLKVHHKKVSSCKSEGHHDMLLPTKFVNTRGNRLATSCVSLRSSADVTKNFLIVLWLASMKVGEVGSENVFLQTRQSMEWAHCSTVLSISLQCLSCWRFLSSIFVNWVQTKYLATDNFILPDILPEIKLANAIFIIMS